MRGRSAGLTAFLTCIRAGLVTIQHTPAASRMLGRAFAALASVGDSATAPPARLPACANLPPAVRTARQAGPAMADLVDAFLALKAQLVWGRRPDGPQASGNFHDGHANAMIVGPGGLEDRGDVRIGLSLLAPFVRYPDHSHPPEEVYLVLSPGRFRQENGEWFEPGIGGSFYNRPNIMHAMASDAAPLFAFWCLLSAP